MKRSRRTLARVSYPLVLAMGAVPVTLGLPLPSSARPHYTRSTFTATYDDIYAGGGATDLVFNDLDDGTASISLPFDLFFAGVNWTTAQYLAVTTNGYAFLTASGTSGSADAENLHLFAGSGPICVLAPYWDDLSVGMVGKNPPGRVAWKVTGSSGSRTLTVQWTNVSSYRTTQFNQPAVLNFQLILAVSGTAWSGTGGTMPAPGSRPVVTS